MKPEDLRLRGKAQDEFWQKVKALFQQGSLDYFDLIPSEEYEEVIDARLEHERALMEDLRSRYPLYSKREPRTRAEISGHRKKILELLGIIYFECIHHC